MTAYHPLRTHDGLRLPLTIAQPSSGMPPMCQTKTSYFLRPAIPDGSTVHVAAGAGVW
jgi:hypothetical protein